MSVTVYGRHDDDAVFEDDNGIERFSATLAQLEPQLARIERHLAGG